MHNITHKKLLWDLTSSCQLWACLTASFVPLAVCVHLHIYEILLLDFPIFWLRIDVKPYLVFQFFSKVGFGGWKYYTIIHLEKLCDIDFLSNK